MSFKEVKPQELTFNPFHAIGDQWMLITAGDEKGYNTMTASWGGAGVLWGKPVATAYIRPQRYTKEFVDVADTFTLSFYPESAKPALKLCGTVSGRDHDKAKEAGLTPLFLEGTAAFAEAELILVCKKLYADTIKPECFLEKEADTKWYPERDYHTMYIAEIVKAFVRE